MSQKQAAAYPPPPVSTGPSAYVAPPPAGYPLKDYQSYAQKAVPLETKSRGKGFWMACLAALGSCCVVTAANVGSAA